MRHQTKHQQVSLFSRLFNLLVIFCMVSQSLLPAVAQAAAFSPTEAQTTVTATATTTPTATATPKPTATPIKPVGQIYLPLILKLAHAVTARERDTKADITAVRWHSVSDTETAFTVRMIGGANPNVQLIVDNAGSELNQNGTPYDVNEFTLNIQLPAPGTYSFKVIGQGVLFSTPNPDDTVSGSFTTGTSGSMDTGIDIGEGAGNPAAYLAAWRADDGPNSRGKPKAEVSTWNGFESQEFWGTPSGSYQARLVLNPRCGQPFFIRDAILEEYNKSVGWLGAPLGHENIADNSYPDWLGQPINEFDKGFISQKPGDGFKSHKYRPSVGMVKITATEKNGDPTKVYLTFETQVRTTPGDPGATDAMKVTMVWNGYEAPMNPIGGETYQAIFEAQTVDIGQTVQYQIVAVRQTDQIMGSYPLDSMESVAIQAGTMGPYGTVRPHPQDVTNCESIGIQKDTTPPTIEFVEIWPDGHGNLSIMAKVTDDRGVATVSLSGGPGETDGTMTLVAGTKYGSGIYGGTFRKVPSNEIVNFTVHATDTSGNAASKAGDSRVPIRFAFGVDCPQCNVGNPVNTGTGNDTDAAIDLLVPGKGGTSIQVIRNGNSQDERVGPFGRGSSFEYVMTLEFVVNPLLNGIQVHYGDGHTTNFNDVGNGRYESISPNTFDYIMKEGIGYVLHQKDLTTYHFDTNGRLMEIRTKSGAAITLNYNGAGKLASLTNASGRTVTLTWSGNLITQIEGPAGKVLHYQYDGNLLKSFTDAAGKITMYEHDAAGRVIKTFTPNGYVHSQETFDERGRVTSQIVGETERRDFSYNDATRTTTVTDANGHKITYAYTEQYLVDSVTDAKGVANHSTYNARGNRLSFTDRNGSTWLFEYDGQGNKTKQIDPIPNNGVTFYATDVTTWEYNSNNQVIKMTDALNQVMTSEYDAQGNLVRVNLPDKSHLTMTYNSFGQPLTVTDGGGNVTRYIYDDITGDLSQVIDGLGNVTKFGYDAIGRQTKITDANGHVIQVEYDGNDNIANVTDAKNQKTLFEYDANNNLLTVIDRLNGKTTHEYDNSDRLVSTTDPEQATTRYDYEAMGQVAKITNPLGKTIQFQYDPNYNLTSKIDEAGAKWQYQYDANNNKTVEIDPLKGRTRLEYDAVNRVKFVTDAEGQRSEYCYNPLDQLIVAFDPRRAESRFDYDPVGRLSRFINPLGETNLWEYDAASNLVSFTNGMSETTRYVYNKANRQIEVINPLNQATRLEYDAVGNITAVTDANKHTTQYNFDENNNLASMTNALSGTVTYQYNAEDLQTLVRDAAGYETTLAYYGDKQLKEVTEPGGAVTSLQYDKAKNLVEVTNALSQTTRYNYEARNLLTAQIDPMGQTTRYNYDELNQLIALTDAKNQTTQYGYNKVGNLTTVTDAKNQTTQYGVDAVGNTVAITYSNGFTTFFKYNFLNQPILELDAMNHSATYAYDDAGRLIRRTDGEWQVTHYEYDAAGQLQSTLFGNDGTRRIDFDYDNVGNMTEMTDGLGTLTRRYDELDRLAQETDYQGQTVSRGYAANGQLVSLIYPDGQVVSYTQGLDNRLESLTMPQGLTATYQYNPLGALTHLEYSNNTQAEWQYNAANQLTSLHHSNGSGAIAWYDYVVDKVGNRTDITEQRLFEPNGAIETFQHHYGYDELNQLVNATTTHNGEVTEQNWQLDSVGNWQSKVSVPTPSAPVTTNYDHNPINSLVQAGEWRYLYDDSGNRTVAQAPLTATQYATMTPYFGTQAELLISYQYDFEQRLTHMEQLIHYVVSDTHYYSPTLESSYQYDGLGRRVDKVITLSLAILTTTAVVSTSSEVTNTTELTPSGEITATVELTQATVLTTPTVLRRHYVFNGLEPIVETESVNAGGLSMAALTEGSNAPFLDNFGLEPTAVITAVVTRTTNYYHANGLLVAMTQATISATESITTSRFYHHDGLGSVVALTNEQGDLVTAYRYDEYGQLLTGDLSENRYAYTGREFDAELGFYYFYARYYDPANGTWLTQDSYRGTFDDPLSLARYAYVTGNPINLVDPLGHFSFNGVKKWVGEHKTAIAIGAAVVAAGIATAATGGLAAPLLAGAIAAGGATMSVNAATGRPLGEDVLNNTFLGASVGLGIGVMGAIAPTTFAWGSAIGPQATAMAMVSGIPAFAAPLVGSLASVVLPTAYILGTGAFYGGASCAFNPFVSSKYRDICLNMAMQGGDTALSAYGLGEDLRTVACPDESMTKGANRSPNKNVHGNDLNTTKKAQGYTLRDRDTGAILKYGETTRGTKRYSPKYLNDNNAKMSFESRGTKREMHTWQHEKILEFKNNNNGNRPPLNKSDW